MPTTTTAERIAEKIRAAMAAKGINQTDLGAALGLSQAGLSRRLLGRVEFTINQLERAAEALDIPLAELTA